MGRNGSCDFNELEKVRDQLLRLDDELYLFMSACAKELAARLFTKVIKRTPVGTYPTESGKKGGTLRRGWTTQASGSGSEGLSANSARRYVETLRVHHFGNTYVIEIKNPVEYASYVEFGHRTRGGKGWVNGRFMLTISEQEVQSASPKILESLIRRKLGECFQ